MDCDCGNEIEPDDDDLGYCVCQACRKFGFEPDAPEHHPDISDMLADRYERRMDARWK